MDTEVMTYDIIIVGGGPAGLSAAIKLKQRALKDNVTLSVLILEKGAEIGSHIISGAVLEPRSLKELLPESWTDAPLDAPVSNDQFIYLTAKRSYRLPTPAPMHNNGNYIISLGNLCKFLAQHAETLGCEIYPGFVASDIIYNDEGAVIGVQTGPVGVDKAGVHTPNYQPGMKLIAKQTLFAEGCRGELSQRLMERYHLRHHAMPQTYGLGIKEVWKVSAAQHHQGLVVHTVGWPLDKATYGGSFIYHMSEQRVAIGFVVGLDYKNPWLNPFNEMQRFKTHPSIKPLFEGGERIAYGARALNEGGWQSIPKLTFPGGMLVGDAAGFLNVAKIKGIHTAMQSGMLAADACFDAFKSLSQTPIEIFSYEEKIRASWVAKELYTVRNIRPGFCYGLWFGLMNAGFETYISRGKSPWTLPHHEDYRSLENKTKAQNINYPKPDGKLTFDRLSSVYLSNTFHAENQPAHLKLKDSSLAISVNYEEYASPETRYCPAGVYEIVMQDEKPRLQINAQNCIHCKTCDIKDPRANIVWTAPEGGGGPNYSGM